MRDKKEGWTFIAWIAGNYAVLGKIAVPFNFKLQTKPKNR